MGPNDEKPIRGWKAIAGHLNWSVKTAQRRKASGLPVIKDKMLGVIAYPSQLDEWVRRMESGSRGPHADSGGVAGFTSKTDTTAPQGPDAHEVHPPLPASDTGARTISHTQPLLAFRARRFRSAILVAAFFSVISAVGMIYAFMRILGGSRRAESETLLVSETANVTDDHRRKRGPVLFDGSRLWFEEEVDDAWRIVSVSAEGGEATPLNVPLKDVRLRDIAIDGSALLLSARAGETPTLWSWPLTGGSPQMLPPQEAESAAWAPDKHAIAFASQNRLILAAGTPPPSTTALASEAVVRAPRWSPGGEYLTFQLMDRKTGEGHLWIADRLGGHPRPVPGIQAAGEDEAQGTWTRDGRYYLFSAGSYARHDLWVVPSSEGFFGSRSAKPSRLTHGPVNWDWPTAGRSTGELFAMGESTQGSLVSLSRSSSVWRPYLGGIPSYELDSSRDGEWVVYVDYPDHTLWKSRVDGSGRVHLTLPGVEAHQPHWSPDGARIAFMGQRPGARWRIMILNSSTRAMEEPIREGEDQGVPTWSPDGRHLLYGDWPFGKRSSPMRLHTLDVFAHRATPIEGSEGLWTPRWSPDGAYICALQEDSTRLMLTRAGQSSWREIMTGVALDNPTWSFDSKYIYVLAQRGCSLLRVNVRTGQVETLADVSEFPTTREAWFGVAPDGSALALQGVPEQEIYALRWVLP